MLVSSLAPARRSRTSRRPRIFLSWQYRHCRVTLRRRQDEKSDQAGTVAQPASIAG